MSDNRTSEGGSTKKGRGPGRIWIVWLTVFLVMVLLLVFRNKMDPRVDAISQYQFEELVDGGQIVHGTVMYDPQSSLNEIIGTYYKGQEGNRIEAPFRAKVRLTGSLERKLLSLPQFEPRQPNTMLLSVVWSVLPIVVIAVLIWFFFIRQIRLAAKTAPNPADAQARTLEQQARFDRVLDKWEEQARRMDAVLDKAERDDNVKE